MISYSDMMSAMEKMNLSINNNYCKTIDIEKLGVAFNDDLEKLRKKLGYPKKV